MTLTEALRQAKSCGVDRLDAQQLLGHLVGRPRSWIIAHEDEDLDPAHHAEWNTLLSRRAAGEPLAYLVGHKEFRGLSLRVSASVLVPRPDTETLVDWGLEHLQAAPPMSRVLDLGTGSGAIALAVKNTHRDADVWATDASPEALAVAQANATHLHLPVQWRLGDWWEAVSTLEFDLVLSNPPYIAEGDPHLDALAHEPRQALTSGPDGMDAVRRIIQQAPAHLRPGAWLLLEHGYDQAELVQGCLRDRGFHQVQTRLDAAHTPRCTGGQWPGPPTQAQYQVARG